MLYSKGDDEKGKNIRYFREMMAAPRVKRRNGTSPGKGCLLETRSGGSGAKQPAVCSLLCLKLLSLLADVEPWKPETKQGVLEWLDIPFFAFCDLFRATGGGYYPHS